MPIALITGITGQDGSYLTELLLDKGYVVHGTLFCVRCGIASYAVLRHKAEGEFVQPATPGSYYRFPSQGLQFIFALW